MPNKQAPPASERLIRVLQAITASELHDQVLCEQIGQRAADPVVRVLIAQIDEDGERHHALLQSILRRLEQEVEFVPSATALARAGRIATEC